MLRLREALEREADELKRLLSAMTLQQLADGGKGGGTSTRVAALVVKSDLAARRLHETEMGQARTSILAAIQQLQKLVDLGAGPVSSTIVSEVARDAYATSEPPGKSPLLQQLLSELLVLQEAITKNMVVALDREQRRQQNSTAVWQGLSSAHMSTLDQAVIERLDAVRQATTEQDASNAKLATFLTTFSERVPAFSGDLGEQEASLIAALARAQEMQNTALTQEHREAGLSAFVGLLDQLRDALLLLMRRTGDAQPELDASSAETEVLRRELEEALGEGEVGVRVFEEEGEVKAESTPSHEPAHQAVAESLLEKIQNLLEKTSTRGEAVPAPLTLDVGDVTTVEEEYTDEDDEVDGDGGGAADFVVSEELDKAKEEELRRVEEKAEDRRAEFEEMVGRFCFFSQFPRLPLLSPSSKPHLPPTTLNPSAHPATV